MDSTNVTTLPGTGETTHQNDDQGVLQNTPELREKIADAVRRLKKIKVDRELLSADKRSILENLVADGVSRKAIERAVKDAELDEDKLERQDFYYTLTRQVMGKPVQGELFEPGAAVTH